MPLKNLKRTLARPSMTTMKKIVSHEKTNFIYYDDLAGADVICSGR